ncbi:HNH endonuclease [Mycetocola tolaasinivorans]|uniref:HNH endonuclease n=1 Tax=Mycetocola tolaasinivorans TaxID=76635 RepID=A0A3L7A230_9MICO|nr:HNH endonuclease [Mycetocola tolaasinivorans]
MAASRTGLTPHLRFRSKVLSRDRKAGITNCPECGTPLDYITTRLPNSAEPDHIIPITKGGTNDPANGRTICRRCNQSRGNRDKPRKRKTPPEVTASPIW